MTGATELARLTSFGFEAAAAENVNVGIEADNVVALVVEVENIEVDFKDDNNETLLVVGVAGARMLLLPNRFEPD